jgi:hypothetical protein
LNVAPTTTPLTSDSAQVVLGGGTVAMGTSSLTNSIGLDVIGPTRTGSTGNATNAYALRVTGPTYGTGTNGAAYIKTGASAGIGIVVDTVAAPTANSQEWRNNGTAVASMGPTGVLTATGARGVTTFPTAPPTGLRVYREDMGAFFRATNNTGGTISTAIASTGSQTVTTTAAHNLIVGDYVLVGTDLVIVTAVPSTTTFTATFAATHAGSSAYTTYRWQQMGDASFVAASRPAAPPYGYRYHDLADDATYRWDGGAYQRAGTRVKLADVTYATDQYSNTATGAAAFGVLGPSVSFTVQDANSTVEVLLNCGVQFSSSAGASQIGIHALIDGTTRYAVCGGVTPAASTFAGLSGGVRNIGSLSAGVHTLQWQFINLNAGTISLLAASFPNYLFFVTQVHENKP